MTPRATVRLQLHRGFTLDDAVATVPYYAALGISHVYASPLLAARSGSTHGYDTIDYGRINPELGGMDALHRLVQALRAHGMGLVLDIVPNHMAASLENAWWLDVLEHGRESPHADWFDIDWEASEPALRGRVLLPALEHDSDALIDRAELALAFDRGDGRLYFEAGPQRFPLAATHYRTVLAELDALSGPAASGGDGDRADATAPEATPREVFDHMREQLRQFHATPTGASAIAAALARHSPSTGAGKRVLRALLDRQHYLLAPWRDASSRINWRRFFDINELVSLRAENEEVFEASHALVLQLYAGGLIDGVRIDHIDGLADPRGYCRRLRARLTELEPQRPADAAAGPAWLLVEKILAHDETLRADWPADGTTGYEFMDQAGALLHDPAGAQGLDQLWQATSEQAAHEAGYDALLRAARRQMIEHNFTADVAATVRAFEALADAEPDAPLAPGMLRDALVELLVHFPRYRTYASPGACDAEDASVLLHAAAEAELRGRPFDGEAMARLLRWLGGDPPQAQARQIGRALDRFQQLTPPLAAKSLEDTTFYRYGRLLSRNEVGADPDRLALPVDGFHAACSERARSHPHTLLATATHDHKRGEDVRARLAVLSELPDAWAAEVGAWRALNADLRGRVDGSPAPDAVDELMLYQTLLGAWPLDARDRGDINAEFIDRIVEWQRKALREGKRRSSWIDPHEGYEAACQQFVRALGRDDRAREFRGRLARFAARIGPAAALNGLTQTLLRLTTPGVPDLYQGCELWDLSLVDPDNRRAVDHGARATALGADTNVDTLLAHWRDGHLKQRLIERALSLRREHPRLFALGGYRPLALAGSLAAHAIAFAREHDGRTLIAAAPLHVARMVCGDDALPHVQPTRWGDTAIALPPSFPRRWRDTLGDVTVDAADARLPLTQALAQWPVCLLMADQPSDTASGL